MADDFLSVDIDDFVTRSLPLIPNAIRKEIADELPDKLLEIVKQEPPYSGGVTRKQAYGVSFFSDKQRRWFFANVDSLDIPYNRTHQTSEGWAIINNGGNRILENRTPNAWRVYGYQQPRILGIIGWKKLRDIMQANKPTISKVIKTAVKMAINRIFRR
jgi:hypothetical protein